MTNPARAGVEPGMEVIASGIVNWDASERRSARYGAVYLSDSPFSLGPAQRCATPTFNQDLAVSLHGRRVRLQARIVETRQSEHCGDVFFELKPSTPEVGEVIDLGVGILDFGRSYDGDQTFILRPNDGRNKLWFDPGKLYRLHSQTVELLVEATEAEFTAAPVYNEKADGMISTGDGVQFKGAYTEGDVVRVPSHKLQNIGGGTIIATPYADGERIK